MEPLQPVMIVPPPRADIDARIARRFSQRKTRSPDRRTLGCRSHMTIRFTYKTHIRNTGEIVDCSKTERFCDICNDAPQVFVKERYRWIWNRPESQNNSGARKTSEMPHML